MPIIAWRGKPSSSGSVTATTCITPWSMSRCTRCRTAASDSPTTFPIAAYERRPSCCSSSMIALETSSRPLPVRSGSLIGRPRDRSLQAWGGRSKLKGPIGKGFRCKAVSLLLNPLLAVPCSDKIPTEMVRSGGVAMAHDRARLGALMQSNGVSRRTFLRGASLSVLALSSGSLLSACGTEGAQQTAESCVSKDLSTSQKKINFSNWPEYIDIATKNVDGDKVTVLPSLAAFEEESGIEVTYNTDVNDNNEFFQKVRNQLGDCQPTGRDIIVLTDWMAARMVGLGWLQKLDHANLTNVDANLVATLKSPSWDKNRDYSVPWQSGLTEIAYNAKYTGEVKSMEELLTRTALKGRD